MPLFDFLSEKTKEAVNTARINIPSKPSSADDFSLSRSLGLEINPTETLSDIREIPAKIGQAVENRRQSFQKVNQDPNRYHERGPRLFGETVLTISDVIAEVGIGIGKTAITQEQEDNVANFFKEGAQEIVETPGVVETATAAQDQFEKLPDTVQNVLGTTGIIALGVADFVTKGRATQLRNEILKQIAQDSSEAGIRNYLQSTTNIDLDEIDIPALAKETNPNTVRKIIESKIDTPINDTFLPVVSLSGKEIRTIAKNTDTLDDFETALGITNIPVGIRNQFARVFRDENPNAPTPTPVEAPLPPPRRTAAPVSQPITEPVPFVGIPGATAVDNVPAPRPDNFNGPTNTTDFPPVKRNQDHVRGAVAKLEESGLGFGIEDANLRDVAVSRYKRFIEADFPERIRLIQEDNISREAVIEEFEAVNKVINDYVNDLPVNARDAARNQINGYDISSFTPNQVHNAINRTGTLAARTDVDSIPVPTIKTPPVPAGTVVNDTILENPVKLREEAKNTPLPDEKTLEFFDATTGPLNKWLRNNPYLRSFQRFFQDIKIDAFALQKKEGLDINDDNNFYQEATIFHGKTHVMLEKARDEATDYVRQALKIATDRGVKLPEVQADIDMFLLTRHAPERNAAQQGTAGSGILTSEAKKINAEILEKYSDVDIENIANGWQSLNEQVLDILESGGIITADKVAELRQLYPTHVPLYRALEGDTDNVFIEKVGGFGARITGIQRATGSDLPTTPITANIMFNLEHAIARANKNKVAQTTAALFRDNSAQIGDSVKIRGVQVVGNDLLDRPIFEKINDNTTIQFYENGKKMLIEFVDPDLKASFSGLKPAQIHQTIRIAATATRTLAALYTKYTPFFALSNKVRDIQEAALNSSGNGRGLGVIKEELSGSSLSTWKQYRAGVDNEQTRLYQDFLDSGGTTGGLGLSTRSEVRLQLDDIFTRVDTTNKNVLKVAQRNLQQLDEWANVWNEAWENSTRFSVYKSHIDAGYSKKQAAFAAKTSTVDFNKTGTATPFVSAVYIFFNASVQGTVGSVRTLAKNPKTALKTAAIVSAAVAGSHEWNDYIDPNWRSKMSKYDMSTKLIILTGSGGENDDSISAIKIPVGFGITPFWTMGTELNNIAGGHYSTISSSVEKISTSFINAYSPLGNGDFLRSVTPSVGAPFLDTERNLSVYDNSIRPAWKAELNRIEQVYNNDPDGYAEDISYKIAEQMYKIGIDVSPLDLIYLYNQYTGGVGKTLKQLTTIAGYVSDRVQGMPSKIETYKLPLVPRFFESISHERANRRTESNQFDNLTDQLKQTFELGQPEEVRAERNAEILRDYVFKNGIENWNNTFGKLNQGGYDTSAVKFTFNDTTDGTYNTFNFLQTKPEDERVRFLSTLSENARSNYLKLQIAQEYPEVTRSQLGQLYIEASIGKSARASKAQMLSHFKRAQLIENSGQPPSWKAIEEVIDGISETSLGTDATHKVVQDQISIGLERGTINNALADKYKIDYITKEDDSLVQFILNKRSTTTSDEWKRIALAQEKRIQEKIAKVLLAEDAVN